MTNKVLITLTIEVPEDDSYDPQEWVSVFADEVSDRLAARKVTNEIILSTNEGIFEYH